MTIEVEMHDGTVLEFPDGTPKAAIQKAVKARIGAGAAQGSAPAPKTAPEGFERAGNLGPADAGMAQAAIRGFIGLKDAERALFPGATALREKLLGGSAAGDKAVLAEIAKEEKEDPEALARGYGDIVGKVGMTAGTGSPASSLYGAAKSFLPRTLKWLAGPSTAAAVSGGEGVALTPGTPEEKLKAGATDAAFGAGLSAAGQGLKKVVTRPFTPTEEAKDLISQGVNPTLQQGADSKVGRFVGGLTSGAINVKDRQNEEVINAFLKRVAPDLDLKDMNVPEKVAILQKTFGDDFDKILANKSYVMSNADRSAIWAAARGPRGTQPEATQNATEAMSKAGAAMQGTAPTRMGSKKLQEYADLLQDQIDKFGQKGVIEGQTRANLTAAKRKYEELVRDPKLTQEERAALDELNSRYGDFLKFQEAAGNPSFHSKPKASDLLRQYAKEEGFSTATAPAQRELLEPAQRVMGLTPTQDEARTLISGLKRAAKFGAGGAVAGGAAAVAPAALVPLGAAYGVSLLGQTGPGARALFGETALQRRMAELMRRGAGPASSAGYALTED